MCICSISKKGIMLEFMKMFLNKSLQSNATSGSYTWVGYKWKYLDDKAIL